MNSIIRVNLIPLCAVKQCKWALLYRVKQASMKSRRKEKMKRLSEFFLILLTIILTSCVTLKEPITNIKGNVKNYSYAFINSTEPLTSSSGVTVYGGYYYSTSKTVNPKDVITGYLTKQGFIVLPELEEELKEKTIIVNYGESGCRDVALGHTTEITIQFIAAETKEIIATSTAEGIGNTEADDIKQAITRALDAIFIHQ